MPGHCKTKRKKMRSTRDPPNNNDSSREMLPPTRAEIKQKKDIEKEGHKVDQQWIRTNKRKVPSKTQDFYAYNDLTIPNSRFLPKVVPPCSTKDRRYVKGNYVGLDSYEYAVKCLLNILQISPAALPRANTKKIPG